MRHTLRPFSMFRLPAGLYRVLPALLLLALSLPSGMGGARPSAPRPSLPSASSLPVGLAPVVAAALAADDAPASSEVSSASAGNAARPFATTFMPDGVRVTSGGGASWGMRLAAIGDGIARIPVPAASPITAAGRVEYRRGDVTEWYVNSPVGLEQGFTLASPPAGQPRGALVLTVGLSEATSRDDGAGGIVLSMLGGAAMQYGNLRVIDATGRALSAWLTARGSEIAIGVDDRGAVYPLVVDPLVQQAVLTASDGAHADLFGWSVAVSGDGNTAVAGAISKSSNAGVVYIFTRSGTTWSQQAELMAIDALPGAGFGGSVAINQDGSTVIVGAPAQGSTGEAYVFTRNGATWNQRQLIASDAGQSDAFGSSVALSGDGSIAIIGAYHKTQTMTGPIGAAYIFTGSGTAWSQVQELTASDATINEGFGVSVAMSADGSTAIVGAPGKNGLTGAAYVFTRSGATWSQQQELTASDPGSPDYFGVSVAVSGGGNTAIVGADRKSGNVGAAYVYTRSGTTWSQQQKLTAGGAAAGDLFGHSVAMSEDGNTTVIGAYANGGPGAAYLFTRSGAIWSQQAKLTNVGSNDLGYSVAMSRDGTTAVIGSPGASNGNGAAYVFAQLPPPAVTAISPTSGPTTGGSPVTITGTGFQTGATVTFGSASATNCAVVNSTTITCTTPPGSAGTVGVTVTNPDTQAATLAGAYTYVVVNALPGPQPTAPVGVATPAPVPVGKPTGVPVTNPTPLPLPPRR